MRRRNCHCDSRESNRESAILEGKATDARSLCGLELHIENIKKRIFSRAGSHVASLEIRVYPEFVEATGIANSYYAKQLVTHALLDGMPGVDIRNSLGVRMLVSCDLKD